MNYIAYRFSLLFALRLPLTYISYVLTPIYIVIYRIYKKNILCGLQHLKNLNNIMEQLHLICKWNVDFNYKNKLWPPSKNCIFFYELKK